MRAFGFVSVQGRENADANRIVAAFRADIEVARQFILLTIHVELGGVIGNQARRRTGDDFHWLQQFGDGSPASGACGSSCIGFHEKRGAHDKGLMNCWVSVNEPAPWVRRFPRSMPSPSRHRGSQLTALSLSRRKAGDGGMQPKRWSFGSRLLSLLINLVEQTAFGEVRFLRLLPATENFIHAEQGQRFEAVGILRENGGVVR